MYKIWMTIIWTFTLVVTLITGSVLWSSKAIITCAYITIMMHVYNKVDTDI